jgi:methyltransferase (TIGR00027 family)
MDAHQASRTAEYMALFRALESARPASRRLFTDPLARGFLSPVLQGVVHAVGIPVLGAALPWFIDRRWPGARASGVARTRLIDDRLNAALGDGINQVVILGAGYDARAYRLPALGRVRVFEVDHPATQAAKQARMRRMLGTLPAHVTFVPLDFNEHSLPTALAAAGFDPGRRSIFIWEGVTNYLSEPTVDGTLRFVGSTADGSVLLFTYVHRDALTDPQVIPGGRRLARTLRRAGESWTFGLDPAAMPNYLAARGLRLLEDIGSVEYRERYLGAHGQHLRGYEFY